MIVLKKPYSTKAAAAASYFCVTRRHLALEYHIMHNTHMPEYIVWYAEDIIEGRWKEAEKHLIRLGKNVYRRVMYEQTYGRIESKL